MTHKSREIQESGKLPGLVTEHFVAGHTGGRMDSRRPCFAAAQELCMLSLCSVRVRYYPAPHRCEKRLCRQTAHVRLQERGSTRKAAACGACVSSTPGFGQHFPHWTILWCGSGHCSQMLSSLLILRTPNNSMNNWISLVTNSLCA